VLELARIQGRGYRKAMATMPPVPSSLSRFAAPAPSTPKAEATSMTPEERRELIARAARKVMDQNAVLLARLAK
jgi:hypothetical protein